MANIYVPFYSRYGNVEAMAHAVAEGVTEQGSVPTLAFTGDVMTPREVIEQDERWLQNHERMMKEYPLAGVDALGASDGAIFGTPTRFGNMTAQMKNFIDQTGGLWMSGALINKPAGCFTSTWSMHGSQEVTTYTMWPPLVVLGMIIVGVPYSVQELLTTTTGGTPYGPSHVAGPTADIPLDETEITICRALGRRVAEVADALAAARG